MLRARLATAAVAIPLLLLLVFAAPAWTFAVVVGAIGVVGLIEYQHLAFPAQPWDRGLGIVLGIVVIGAASFGPEPLAAAIAVLIAVGLVWTYLVRSDFERALADLGLSLVGILYVGVLLPHFVWLRRVPGGPAWILLILATAMAGDSFGYFVGHAWGRHKLIAPVSPGKTVEGAFGIIAGNLLAAAAVKLVLLDFTTWREILVLAVVMSILGQLGDLSKSVMKRTFGVKESGWLFPGHGGVLDRIDSLLFPVTFVYYYVVWLR